MRHRLPDGSLSGIHACKLVPASVVAQVIGPLLERPYETQDGLECCYAQPALTPTQISRG
jgi:hypothetical protein